MTPIEVLDELLKVAIERIKSKKSKKYSEIIILNIDVIFESIDKNKSLVSALLTSLLKKIIDPEQDVRLHRKDFEGGYSARSLDTDITTPFLKQHFPKYANKESGFLSIATRTQIPWTKEDGNRIRTRASKAFMNSFLEIFDAIESKKIYPKDTLIYCFENLRLIDDYKEFIKSYTRNLVDDSKNSTEIKEMHITAWKRILEEHKLDR